MITWKQVWLWNSATISLDYPATIPIKWWQCNSQLASRATHRILLLTQCTEAYNNSSFILIDKWSFTFGIPLTLQLEPTTNIMETWLLQLQASQKCLLRNPKSWPPQSHAPLYVHLVLGTQNRYGYRKYNSFLWEPQQPTMMTACDGEVLALRASGNWRSCCQHDCYGMVVVPNDILSFKLTIIDGIGGGKEVDNEDSMP